MRVDRSSSQESPVVADAEKPADCDLRTLVFAPLGQDGPLTCQLLADAGLPARNCRDTVELCTHVEAGCGALLLAEEVLDATAPSGLVETLARQPPWSDVPIVIVTSDGRLGEERIHRFGVFGPAANVSFLERPFRPVTLISAINAGLRARRRQYQIRDLLNELQVARDNAERANMAKDDFLAALSHELRTPLNPVLLLASEAALDPTTPPVLRGDFEMIARNVELEARLIDDLLDLTRITRGKLVLDLQRHDVHAALHDALTAIQTEAQNRSLTLRLNLHASRTEVMADPVRLQQVLWNVLKNAVKFTPDSGTIVIRTRNPPGGSRIAVEITDSGIGMTPEEIASAFDAFAQGEHAGRESSRRFGGLGLGLAIARMLLELHGGSIRAASRGRDHGSTFALELPLVGPLGTRGRASATDTASPNRGFPDGSNPWTGSKSVLLVEDHAATRHSLVRLLRRRGYAVTSAQSIAEAKAAARGRHFDLLISDLGLPDGNGCELVAAFRENFGQCVALSGYGMEEDIARSERAGFDAHLVKPLTIQSLDRALAALGSPLLR